MNSYDTWVLMHNHEYLLLGVVTLLVKKCSYVHLLKYSALLNVSD